MTRNPKSDKLYQRTRTTRTIAGFIVALGGCTLAIVRPEHAYLGIGAALVGAGLVEPTQLFPFLTSKKE